MKIKCSALYIAGLIATLGAPAYATVAVSSLTSSVSSPQLLGTSVTWTATGTDTGAGPLTFQFNVTPPGGSLMMIKDFNTGTLKGSTYTSQPFVWVPTASEGKYKVQVVVKDFSDGSTAMKTMQFTVTPLVTGNTPVVTATANPLVALFSSPACAKGSKMRVSFQQQSLATPATLTNFVACKAGVTMNFEIAGMYQSTAYTMFSETLTKGKIKKGAEVTYTTGALPKNITFPTYSLIVPATSAADTADSMLLINSTQLGNQQLYPNVAVDLTGNFLWYYFASPTHGSTLTRPLANSSILTIQYGQSWNTATQNQQLLRQIDLAGNLIKETNTGVVQQGTAGPGRGGWRPMQRFWHESARRLSLSRYVQPRCDSIHHRLEHIHRGAVRHRKDLPHRHPRRYQRQTGRCSRRDDCGPEFGLAGSLVLG